jgi:predicted ATPase
VISSVEIKGLRGIREGELTGLTPLVVLVGPNGSGKSTVIEGILVGVSPNAADAILQVVRRHEAGGSGPRWLLWRAGEAGPTEITVTTPLGTSRKCQLELPKGTPEDQTNLVFTIIENETRRLGVGQVLFLKKQYHSHVRIGFFPLEDMSVVSR